MKFRIKYGIGGGFNDIREKTEEFESTAEAGFDAYQSAIEVFEEYEGTGGLRDISEIMEEEECNQREATSIYNEERESWLEYSIEKIDE